jgi:general secretion pathway protein H
VIAYRSPSGAARQRGFTLLEILVVMALLGVAMLVATGGAEPLVRAARERGWGDRLQAELVRTRGFARASGTIGVVDFLPDERRIQFSRGPQTGALALPEGVRLETGAGDLDQAQSLLFFPDGSASELEVIFAAGSGRATRLRVAGVSGKIELKPAEPAE